MPDWIHSRWVACVIAMVTGALIWAASPRVTGASEPWDAAGFYHVGALALAGCVIGLVAPKRSAVDVGYLLSVHIGVFGGQLGYALCSCPQVLCGYWGQSFSRHSVLSVLLRP